VPRETHEVVPAWAPRHAGWMCIPILALMESGLWRGDSLCSCPRAHCVWMNYNFAGRRATNVQKRLIVFLGAGNDSNFKYSVDHPANASGSSFSPNR
jgi:hypothetical protein